MLKTESEPKTNFVVISKPESRQVLFERGVELVTASLNQDTLIFMDKTARPLAQIYRRIFDRLYPNRQRPEIKFLNIGKEKTYLLKRLGLLDKEGEYLKKEDRFDCLTDTDDLIEVFSEDCVAELFSLNFSGFGRRIAVDDLCYRGDSKALVLKILSIVDRGSTHSFFPFLNTVERRMHFMTINFSPYMPWNFFNLTVADPKDSAKFLAVPQQDRSRAIQLRIELDMLVEEGFVKYPRLPV